VLQRGDVAHDVLGEAALRGHAGGVAVVPAVLVRADRGDDLVVGLLLTGRLGRAGGVLGGSAHGRPSTVRRVRAGAVGTGGSGGVVRAGRRAALRVTSRPTSDAPAPGRRGPRAAGPHEVREPGRPRPRGRWSCTRAHRSRGSRAAARASRAAGRRPGPPPRTAGGTPPRRAAPGSGPGTAGSRRCRGRGARSPRSRR